MPYGSHLHGPINVNTLKKYQRDHEPFFLVQLYTSQVKDVKIVKNSSLHVVLHAPFSIHLWSKNSRVSATSRIMLSDALKTADACGAFGLVVHLQGTPTINEIKNIFDNVPKGKCPIFLENHYTLNYEKYTEPNALKEMLTEINKTSVRTIAACIDTAHLWSQGFDVCNNLKTYLDQCEDIIALIHLNDSEYRMGSGKDKHTSIGNGKIWSGNENTAKLVAKSGIPFILEHQDLLIETAKIAIWTNEFNEKTFCGGIYPRLILLYDDLGGREKIQNLILWNHVNHLFYLIPSLEHAKLFFTAWDPPTFSEVVFSEKKQRAYFDLDKGDTNDEFLLTLAKFVTPNNIFVFKSSEKSIHYVVNKFYKNLDESLKLVVNPMMKLLPGIADNKIYHDVQNFRLVNNAKNKTSPIKKYIGKFKYENENYVWDKEIIDDYIYICEYN